ncbi:MAG TPA: response regulator [Gemmatimonadales bacterium]|jgi:CheY-like chemotaxis protein|nr:response regulator [Gemmatimonadales bacterium]
MPTPPTGTILLVDDEDGVRVTLRRQLTAQGHTVLEASHGAEALAVARMRRGNLDLVLSDVVMPEMNGTELAATLGRDFPGLPVILMSAYAPAGLTQVGPDHHTVPVLQKPFGPGQLEELILVALDMQGRRRRDGRSAAAL